MLTPFVGGWPTVHIVKKSQTLAAPARWRVCLATGVFLLGSLALGRAMEPPKVAQTPISADPVGDLITYSSKYATIVPLIPGPNDPKIARLVANLLERAHYSQQPLDDEMARRFLRRYLDMLDPTHSLFLQTDVDEFARFQPKLPELTLKEGSTLPAREIFARFLERVEERVEFVAGLLQSNHFEFTGSDRFGTDRKHAAWPQDAAANSGANTSATNTWRRSSTSRSPTRSSRNCRPATSACSAVGANSTATTSSSSTSPPSPKATIRIRITWARPCSKTSPLT
jgi:hypothetical protein